MAEYIAGICNIGSVEIARRRNFGWGALIIAVVLLVVLIWTAVNPWWRLFVFFPATMSAAGFLQAHFHFCAGFARRGVYNFGALGQTTKVVDAPSTIKDKSRGNQITLYSVLIGIVVAILCAVL